MGPLADLKIHPDNEKLQNAIRWIDNMENDKTKLVTNKSEDDLIYKEEVGQVERHKVGKNVKPSIKPFN